MQFSLRLFIGAGTVPITTKPINTLEMCQFNTISISSATIILLSPLSSTRSYKRFINYAHIRRKLQIIDYVDFSALQRFLCPSSVQQNDFRELSTSIGGCYAIIEKVLFLQRESHFFTNSWTNLGLDGGKNWIGKNAWITRFEGMCLSVSQ